MARRTKEIEGDDDDGVRMSDAIRRLEDLMTESGPGFDAPVTGAGSPDSVAPNLTDTGDAVALARLNLRRPPSRAQPRRATRITGKSKLEPKVASDPPAEDSAPRATDWGVPVARSLKAPPPRPVEQPALREPTAHGGLTDAREIAAAMRAAVPVPAPKIEAVVPASHVTATNGKPAVNADQPDSVTETLAPPPYASATPLADDAPRSRRMVDRVLAHVIGRSESEIKDALSAHGHVIQSAVLFSGVIAMLALSIPALAAILSGLFVIGRSSAPLTTPLFSWLAFTVCALTAGAALRLIRARIFARVASAIDRRIDRRVLDVAIRDRIQGAPPRRALESDLACLRAFLSGPAPAAAADCLWVPIFLVVLAVGDAGLALLALVCLMLGAALARMIARGAALRIRAADRASSERRSTADMTNRDSEALAAMGMLGVMRARMAATSAQARTLNLAADDTVWSGTIALSVFGIFARVTMLAAASWLALSSAITLSFAVAAYLLFELAFAPISAMLGATPHCIGAIDAIRRIDAALAAAPLEKQRDDLPKPSGAIAVAALRVARPGARGYLLSGITFSAEPGRIVAVTGPSGAGKSALLKAMAGIWPTFGGSVMIDGTRIDQWHPGDLGRHIGFLSQNADLFPGTVAENIARFDGAAEPSAITAAAEKARAGALIASLADGMATRLGPGAASLSAGERQRIALARALYCDPAIVLLDDPSAHLDRQAVRALHDAIKDMRARRQTVIVATEDAALIALADEVLGIEGGRQTSLASSSTNSGAAAALAGPEKARA